MNKRYIAITILVAVAIVGAGTIFALKGRTTELGEPVGQFSAGDLINLSFDPNRAAVNEKWARKCVEVVGNVWEVTKEEDQYMVVLGSGPWIDCYFDRRSDQVLNLTRGQAVKIRGLLDEFLITGGGGLRHCRLDGAIPN